MIDGGLAQVNTARRVLLRAGIKIPIVGIAKGPKRDRNDIIGLVPKGVQKRRLSKRGMRRTDLPSAITKPSAASAPFNKILMNGEWAAHQIAEAISIEVDADGIGAGMTAFRLRYSAQDRPALRSTCRMFAWDLFRQVMPMNCFVLAFTRSISP